jgi:hypothetical protein
MAVSSLAINLIARTRVFDRKIKKSRGHVRSFGTTAQRVTSRLKGLLVGALAAAGVTGLGFLIRRTMASIDETSKLARALDISTEALIGFGHAAAIEGVAVEGLNKGLQMMVRRLAESTTGVGEAKYGLNILRMEAEDLLALGTEKAFIAIAEGIRKIPDAATKAYVAYTLFGRSGQNLVNVLNLGARGLAENRREAIRLGIAYSGIDAKKVEEANDAIERLKRMFQGVANLLVIKIAPTIDRIVTGIVDWGTRGEGLKANLLNVFESISLGMYGVGDSFIDASIKWNAFVQTLLEGKIILKTLIPAWGLIAGIEEDLKRLKQLKRELVDLVNKSNKYKRNIRDAFAVLREDAGGKWQPKVDTKVFEAAMGKLETAQANYQREIDQFDVAPIERALQDLQALGDALDPIGLKIFNIEFEKTAKLARELAALQMGKETKVAATRAAEDAQDWAQGLIERTRSPIAKLADDMKKLMGVYEKGLIDQEQFLATGNVLAREHARLRSQAASKLIGGRRADAMELRPMLVSVRGLSMEGGRDLMLNETKTQTEILKSIDAGIRDEARYQHIRN